MKAWRNVILLLALVAVLAVVNVYRRPSNTPSPLQPAGKSSARAARNAPPAIPDAELHVNQLAATGQIQIGRAHV